MVAFSVPVNNWSATVDQSIRSDIEKGSNSIPFLISVGTGNDPAVGCSKSFNSSYACGGVGTKTVSAGAEANGKTVIYDCTTEANKCFDVRVSMEDTGEVICVAEGGQVVWRTGVPSVKGSPVPVDAFRASSTPLGRNYLQRGETLSAGQVLGSPSGKYALRVNPSNGTQLEVVSKVEDARSVGDAVIGNSGFVTVYTLADAGSKNVGKVGYIDINGSLRAYPNPMITYKDTFRNLGNFVTSGTTISSGTESSLDACKQKCIDASGCAGFNYNPTTTQCTLKRADMFPVGKRIVDTEESLYVRDKGVVSDQSCPSSVSTIYGDEWDSYPKGDEMAHSTQCLLGAITKEQRARLANKRKELDAVADTITDKVNHLVESGTKISEASSTGRQQLKRDMEEYTSQMQKFNRTTTDLPTMDGGLETSVRQTLMERSRVGMWAAVGVVSVGVLVYLMRRRKITE